MNTNIFFDISMGDALGIPLPRTLTVHNRGDAIEGARLVIKSTGEALLPFETDLPVLAADSATPVNISLALAPHYHTCHMLRTELVLSVLKEQQPLYSMAVRLEIPASGEDTICKEVNTENAE